jgi:hypothetical protein
MASRLRQRKASSDRYTECVPHNSLLRILILLSSLTSGACVGPLAGVPPRPRVGLDMTGPSETAALQGDETASLAAGKTLDIDTGTWRVVLDLPATRGKWAGTGMRLGVGARLLQGTVGAVSLAELQTLAPGVADLIVQTAKDFEGFLSKQGDSLLDRGTSALSGNLANRIRLRDVGADVSFGLLVAGPRFSGAGIVTELLEFEMAAIVHFSSLKIELTKADGRESRNRFFAFGFGLTMRLAPFTLHLPGDLALQPAALRTDIFALMTHKNLRAIVVSLAWSAQLSWGF